VTTKTRMTKGERASLYRALADCLALIPRENHPQAAIDALGKHLRKDFDREQLRWMHWAAVKAVEVQGAVTTDNEIFEQALNVLADWPLAQAGMFGIPARRGWHTVKTDYYACEKATCAPGSFGFVLRRMLDRWHHQGKDYQGIIPRDHLAKDQHRMPLWFWNDCF
jgi:hypothetical protein